jgi:dTDP-4-amino-4,6-dideoxygalactose transaminase
MTPRTRAIVAVHLFGRMADVVALSALARDHNIHLIEDVAQAAGAERDARRAGTFGTVGTFSFFPAKPLGCDGDGGACATRDAALAETMARVRVTGATAKNVHDLPGGNYRLAPLQAAILGAKLPHYEARIAKRRAHAEALRVGLAGASSALVLPTDDTRGRHVYAQFTVRHPRRDALMAALKARGVGSEVYYPRPMPLQRVLSSLGHREGDFPHAERACAEVLSLPVHSELDDTEVTRVIEVTREALRTV